MVHVALKRKMGVGLGWVFEFTVSWVVSYLLCWVDLGYDNGRQQPRR